MDSIGSFFSFGGTPAATTSTASSFPSAELAGAGDAADPGAGGFLSSVGSGVASLGGSFFGSLLNSGGNFIAKNGFGFLLEGGSTALQIQANTQAAKAVEEEHFFEGRQALLAERVAKVAGREDRFQIRESLERALASMRAAAGARGGTRGGSTQGLLDFTTAQARRGEQNSDFNSSLAASQQKLSAANSFSRQRLALQAAKTQNTGLLADLSLNVGRRVT